MENNTFRSVTFGGFAKQDVVEYIERTSREASEVQEQLRREKEALSQEAEALRARVAELEHSEKALREKTAELTRQRDTLSGELDKERTARQELESARAEAETLRAETERLRPDAEAYAQFRERLGAIECEARKRAADLEEHTIARMEKAVSAFRARYQEVSGAFDATAVHVTGELRKVEVNLSQLPRALDQTGADLKELAEFLEKTKSTQ